MPPDLTMPIAIPSSDGFSEPDPPAGADPGTRPRSTSASRDLGRLSMALEWTNATDDLDWLELEELYRLAPLAGRTAAGLKIAYGGSRYKWLVREGWRLVAAGRALADGADCSYICDVAVRPSHQGTGLGKALVARLVEDSREHRKIILYARPGTEGFYRKLGFLRLATAMAQFQDREWAIRRGHLSET